jgi:predicted DNA-binding protein
MPMSDRDDAAAAYYEDPEHRKVTGPSRKRAGQAPRLTTHVPIRFSSAVIERVKELASEDGKTVSSWIRDVIDREVLRRGRSRTVGAAATVQWASGSGQLSSTRASGAEDIEELEQLVS